MEDLSRGLPLSAKAHLEPRVDSWRAGEALLQPLTRPTRIDGPAEAETSSGGKDVQVCDVGNAACGRRLGRVALISLQAHLSYAKNSWRIGEALLIASNTPYAYCSPRDDQGELVTAMVE